MNHRVRGFYSVLDSADDVLARDLLRSIEDGGCGAKVLQVRVKPTATDESRVTTTTAELMAIARMARALCSEYGALCIVNDRIDVALATGADGVHLGQQDMSLADARSLLGQMKLTRPFVVGISTNSPREVERACRGGADYVGFGPVFPTTTKTDPDPYRGLEGLRAAVAAAGDVPVVAIGGITPGSAREIARAGAAAACCISAVNHVPDRAEAGAAIVAAFS
ncbi:MAG: thiamine phosphate synthase [Nannocystaceae bacterium]